MTNLKTGIALLCAFAFPAQAMAGMPCGDRAVMIKHLSEKYKEGPVSLGTAGGKHLVEIYASEEGTFTIIASQPDGQSCIIAAGQDWEQVGPPPKNLTSL